MNHNRKDCGPKCLRCWRNKLKHTNKTAKKWMQEHPKETYKIAMPEVPKEIPEEIPEEVPEENSRKRRLKLVNNGLHYNDWSNLDEFYKD